MHDYIHVYNVVVFSLSEDQSKNALVNPPPTKPETNVFARVQFAFFLNRAQFTIFFIQFLLFSYIQFYKFCNMYSSFAQPQSEYLLLFFFLKKGCPGWGANPGSFDFHI
jgi:hypothetical protein